MQKKLFIFSLCFILAIFAVGCGDSNQPTSQKIKRKEIKSEELQFTSPKNGDTIAIFDTSMGEIRAVLYTDLAVQACENFIALANDGFFAETEFSKVSSGFFVQGGFSTDGTAHTIWNDNGYPIETTDKLHHYTGALCAPVNEDGLASSAFYFVQSIPENLDETTLTKLENLGVRAEVIETYKIAGGEPQLDYTDTVFGQVYEGVKIMDLIGSSEVDENLKPLEAIILHSVNIETFTE